jgi:chorismate dehydratase
MNEEAAASVLRIGVVNFLNAYPLWGALEPGAPKDAQANYQLIPDVPSALVRRLRDGELDCALISSVAYFQLPPGYVYHENLGIAAHDKVWSIRLFVGQNQQNFSKDIHGIRKIFTDSASRSSVAQLKMILRAVGVSVPLEEILLVDGQIPQLGRGEALLAIGDTALSNRKLPSYDLQEIYFSLFKRGFVYALWVYPNALEALCRPILDRAYNEYTRDPQVYIDRAAARFHMEPTMAAHYLKRIIRHELADDDLQNLAFFEVESRSDRAQ